MARVHSILAAFSLAALVGVASVKPAAAVGNITTDQLIFVVNTTGSVMVTGSVVNSAANITNGLYLSPLLPGAPAGLTATTTNLVGQSSLNLPAGTLLATFNAAGVAPGDYNFALKFDDDVIGNQGSFTVRVTDTAVPEPGAIAFGVIAAGSVLGLVARRRKTA